MAHVGAKRSHTTTITATITAAATTTDAAVKGS